MARTSDASNVVPIRPDVFAKRGGRKKLSRDEEIANILKRAGEALNAANAQCGVILASISVMEGEMFRAGKILTNIVADLRRQGRE